MKPQKLKFPSPGLLLLPCLLGFLADPALAQVIPFGNEFQVNTYTSSYQALSSVSPDGAGGLVVTWQSLGSSGTDNSSSSIQAQRYSTSGSALGDQFQVNTFTTSYQAQPSVSPDGAGSFVVT